MCSRIARAFLLSCSRQPPNHNDNLKKKICSGTTDEPDLESKVDHEFPGQMGSYDPHVHARW